ncbi:MAG: macro domain-containing protein [Oscillospiraceae bacterium]|nr:macro domain-containing protein [Oscillospiraceae bacterium]
MPFQIIRNDITKVEADAIVNTANPEAAVGGGTDWAIHKAAGPELLEARKKIGEIEIGQSAATPAFQLSAKYVLHTVSPAWIDGHHREEELLRKAYDAALQLADELECKSVAFPLMAAGTYGFPQDLALSVAIRAFTDFLLEHEMQIYLVLFNARAFGIAGSIFDDLKSYIDDNYVAERSEEEHLIDARPYANLPARPRRREELAGVMRAERRRARRETFDACMTQPAPLEKPKAAAAMLEDALKQHEKTFSEYLLDLLRERNGKDSEVYKRAEVSKQLFSKILNNPDYQPTKSTVIQLAVGLELNVPQTQKLLEKAGYALTRSSKADIVVEYCIRHKLHSVPFINEALYDCGLPLLKTGLKA